MSDVTGEVLRYIQRFMAAQENVERQKSALGSAECEVRNAERELAKWLMPCDMQPGEKIAVWYVDSLFQVELEPRTAYQVGGGDEDGKPVVTHEPKVTVRTRGKNHYRLREAS